MSGGSSGWRAMLRLAPLAAAARRGGRRHVSFRLQGQARSRRAAVGLCRATCWRPESMMQRSGPDAPWHRGGSRRPERAVAGRSPITWAARTRLAAPHARNVDAWTREIEGAGLDAIVTTASGCGTMMKDYGFMLRRRSSDQASRAAKVAGITYDISEFVSKISSLNFVNHPAMRVAYHPACSLAHGQRVVTATGGHSAKAGFVIVDPPESHLCCGSAGTYNILQPDLANRLRDRKIANIHKVMPELIATGNIGCITQIAAGTQIPVVHTIELIDWATGGAAPKAAMPMHSPELS